MFCTAISKLCIIMIKSKYWFLCGTLCYVPFLYVRAIFVLIPTVFFHLVLWYNHMPCIFMYIICMHSMFVLNPRCFLINHKFASVPNAHNWLLHCLQWHLQQHSPPQHLLGQWWQKSCQLLWTLWITCYVKLSTSFATVNRAIVLPVCPCLFGVSCGKYLLSGSNRQSWFWPALLEKK